MTKEEYQALEGVEISKWTHKQCVEADQLIKAEALKKAEVIIKALHPTMDDEMSQFLNDMLRYNFGSGEVDNFLMHLNAYPEWMHKD